MAENVSPEEKLFKIIQNEKNSPSPGPGPQNTGPGKSDRVKQFFTGLNPLRHAHAALGRTAPERILHAPRAAALMIPVGARATDLKAINKMLVLFLVIATVLAFYYLLKGRPNIADISASVSDIPFRRSGRKTIETFKPLNFYLDMVKKRDILHSLPTAEEIKAEALEMEPEPELANLAESLKLAGISMGTVPKAMVEDTIDGQVYFVKIGQTIGATGIKVKSISKDSVIITYGKEEMQLL
ncbi:MAG: hypothetical protein NG740_07590 [Omnitrophica bacterium]|nr:hypothetical protein [Candidatus Omnitrophota bacterium]